MIEHSNRALDRNAIMPYGFSGHGDDLLSMANCSICRPKILDLLGDLISEAKARGEK